MLTPPLTLTRIVGSRPNVGDHPHMTARTAHGPCIMACTLLVVGLVVLVPGDGRAGTTPIYKCLDKNLGLLYTDEPCTDGEQLNIRAGDADPAAVARLDRARDALDQSAAQRLADERRFAMQRDLAMWLGYGGEAERGAYDYAAADAPYDYAWMWWYPSFARAHPPRSRSPWTLEHRRFAPSPPYTVPRR